jgi:hypothetical protein
LIQQELTPRWVCFWGREYQRRSHLDIPQMGLRWEVKAAAHDHPTGVVGTLAVGGQPGVIATHRVAPDHHGIAGGSQLVDGGSGRWAGHPGAVTAGRSNFAVKGHGVFEQAQGALTGDPLHKCLVQPLASRCLNPDDHLHPCLAKPLNA